MNASIKLQKTVVFSRTPLKCKINISDHFQLYPCDFTEAPKSLLVEEFPIILEYWLDESKRAKIIEEDGDFKEFITLGTLKMNEVNRICRLISAITNYRIFVPDMAAKWGVLITDEELSDEDKKKLNKQNSQPILVVYKYEELPKHLSGTGFSTSDHSEAKFIKHSEYYLTDPIESKLKEIVFPNSIFQILNNYFDLNEDDMNVVNSIIHLIANGIDLRVKMKSLSFLAFVSAIETLVNHEYKNKNKSIEYFCNSCQTIKSSSIHCAKCGRPIWGVKAKFNEFLTTYVSKNPNSITKYNKIYNLRSSITHNGMLLLGDEYFEWNSSTKSDSQTMSHLEVMQIARISLVNWLLARK